MNNDTVKVLFSEEKPAFIEYNSTENALVYNFTSYRQPNNINSIKRYDFFIILEDDQDAKRRYNITI